MRAVPLGLPVGGDKTGARPASTPEVLVVLGTIAAAAGFGLLAIHAFPVPGDALALPFIGVALVAASAFLVRVDPLGPRRHLNEP